MGDKKPLADQASNDMKTNPFQTPTDESQADSSSQTALLRSNVATTMGRRPLTSSFVPLAAASAICFAFLTAVPILTCIYIMSIDGDAGGPMFLPILVMGIVFLAAVITICLACVAFLIHLLHRRFRFSIWIPPTVVVVALLAIVLFLVAAGDVHPWVLTAGGSAIAVAFAILWASLLISDHQQFL